jgi:hypothetical protein
MDTAKRNSLCLFIPVTVLSSLAFNRSPGNHPELWAQCPTAPGFLPSGNEATANYFNGCNCLFPLGHVTGGKDTSVPKPDQELEKMTRPNCLTPCSLPKDLTNLAQQQPLTLHRTYRTSLLTPPTLPPIPLLVNLIFIILSQAWQE